MGGVVVLSVKNKMRPVTAGNIRTRHRNYHSRPLSSFNPDSSDKNLLSLSSYQPPKYLVPEKIKEEPPAKVKLSKQEKEL